jgi:hypothetical protein
MAEGLIQQNDDSRQLEELGGEYFRELVSWCPYFKWQPLIALSR